MTVTKKFVIATIALGVLVMTGCNRSAEVSSAVIPVEEQETVYAVNTYVTGSETLDEYLEFGGDVGAVSSVDILPDTSGKLTGIRVSLGDTVVKDQLLAYVDASRPGMNYEASPVRAPVAGTITSFPVAAGSMVSPSVSIGKISSTRDLEITISVAERFVSRIKKGQKAVLMFDAYPEETFSANVTEVNPVLDSTSRSMSVKLQLDPRDDRIKIGMYSRVKLITDTKKDVVAVPRSAVVTRMDQTFVFLVDSATQTVTQVPVTTGISVDDKVEIVSGLAAGNEVVISGQTLLDNGSRVNVVSRQGVAE